MNTTTERSGLVHEDQPRVQEMERLFAILKDQLRIGWDKVTISQLTELEQCARSIEWEIVDAEQIARWNRAQAVLKAVATSWREKFGTSRFQVEGPYCDLEFEELRCRANTVLADLQACMRILYRKAFERSRVLRFVHQHLVGGSQER